VLLWVLLLTLLLLVGAAEVAMLPAGWFMRTEFHLAEVKCSQNSSGHVQMCPLRTRLHSSLDCLVFTVANNNGSH
jgi:hypothetical protein